jgi:hypothetical protein
MPFSDAIFLANGEARMRHHLQLQELLQVVRLRCGLFVRGGLSLLFFVQVAAGGALAAACFYCCNDRIHIQFPVYR